MVIVPAAAAQPTGLFEPVPRSADGELPSASMPAEALRGSLRLCPLDGTRLAYDLRLGPGALATRQEAPTAADDGCVGFGVMEAGEGGFHHAAEDFHLTVRAAVDGTLELATIGAGGTVCTRDRLPDGTWRRIGDCAVWRPLEVQQTQAMLRDLGLLDIPFQREATPAFTDLLSRLVPDLPGVPAQTIATLVRLRWRADCALAEECP